MSQSDSAEEMDQAGRSAEGTAGGKAGPDTGRTSGGTLEQTAGAAKRFMLAGLGAFASACDTAAEQYDRFVVRGQRVQEEWQDKADEVRRQNVGARGRVQDSFRSAMDGFLNSLNIPSKGDVDTINTKLNILSRKLDDIQLDRVAQSGSGTARRPPKPPAGDVAT